MTAPLTALLERVEAATGPLDRIQAESMVAAGPWPWPSEEAFLFMQSLIGGVPAVGCALALVERVLPGASIHLHWFPGHSVLGAEAHVGTAIGRGPTPALAILSAAIRALHALASRDAAGPADAEEGR